MSLEIKQERELALDKDEEIAEDHEIRDVSALFIRIKGMEPADHSPTIYSNSYLISMSRCLICGTATLIDSYTCTTAISINRTTGKNGTPGRAIIHQPWTSHRYQFYTASVICARRPRCKRSYVLPTMTKTVLAVSFISPCGSKPARPDRINHQSR